VVSGIKLGDYAGIISGIIGSFENQALCGNNWWKKQE
jgi:hypothetical protein